MRRILVLVTVLAAFGCAREEAARPENGADDPQVEYTSSTIKAEQKARKEMALIIVDEAVQGFKVMQKRFPETLSELTEKGMLASLPDLPEGMVFTYDSETGAIDISEGMEEPAAEEESAGEGDEEEES